ncbi:peptide deformylase [soil metagenome]
MDIVLEGDPRLRQKATKIRQVDDSLRRIAENMHETMLDAPGVGLAGPQVGVMRRIAVVHLPAEYVDEDDPDITLTLINPEIVKGHGRVVAQEGCLSIPHWVGMVPRFETITAKAMDLNNRHVRIKAEGMLARVIQHEVDHLDGILFVDRVEDKSTLFEVDDETAEDEFAVAG